MFRPALRAALRLAFAVAAWCFAFPSAAPAAEPLPIAVPAQEFQFLGDWDPQGDLQQKVLYQSPDTGKLPAVTGVEIAQPGRYRLWVRSRDWPSDRPGIRNFAVRVGGHRAEKRFGTSGKPGYTWEDGGWFDLPAGTTVVCLEDARPFARCQGVLFSADASYVPEKAVAADGIRPTKGVPLAFRSASPQPPAAGDALAAPYAFHITSREPLAELSNAHLRLAFLAAQRDGLPTVAVRAEIPIDGQWVDAGTDPAAEGYYAVVAGASAALRYTSFYPQWSKGTAEDVVLVAAGDQPIRTARGRWRGAVWEGGTLYRLNPVAARREGNAVRIAFDRSPAGTLEARWELPANARAASVALSLSPTVGGQVALGYTLFFRRPPADVQEVLLPLMWQRHRLPARPVTLPDSSMPTPLALAQPTGQPRTFAVCRAAETIPFAWPDGRTPGTALGIVDAGGQVQPSIWGPVLGTSSAQVQPGRQVELRFCTLVQPGDWYAGYRSVADDVYQLRDYRRNVAVSLTDAVLNMIDLAMNDQAGGWWERAKAWYQIESRNGSSHAAPLILLSLYRLTGDREIYRRRALPTLEFVLSRSGPHFCPVPSEGGLYDSGHMLGPLRMFGTCTYTGLWELTNRRTGVLAAIGLPADGIKSVPGYNHARPFDDWLGRYRITGEKQALENACADADRYVKKAVLTPPTQEMGPEPFFYIQFLPDWEGLLQLYEATGRKDYLEAAALGARQLMTGIWTQPVVPDRDVTIHADGQYHVASEYRWWRGPTTYRLGLPRKPNDTPSKTLPAWIVSNVGLGFEQPSTLNSRGAERLIFQAAWAPHFLRLYRYTHDPAFLTYARNAVIGRWGNYPGYYITGFTDLPQGPRYPLDGPDVTDLYYHHIVPQLTWMIDYLVSEAEMLSEGRITFPALRQHGYAYFDSRVFGHAPGRVCDDPAAWLVFRRDLATLDNPQCNHLLADGRDGLHVILMNESPGAQTVHVQGLVKTAAAARLRVGNGAAVHVPLIDGRATVSLPPRGLAVLTLPKPPAGLPSHAPPSQRRPPREKPMVVLNDAVAETRGVAIQADPGAWDAYVWSTATPEKVQSATLHYASGARQAEVTVDRYPFEFSIPVAEERDAFVFHVDLTRPDGSVVHGPEGTLRIEPRE